MINAYLPDMTYVMYYNQDSNMTSSKRIYYFDNQAYGSVSN